MFTSPDNTEDITASAPGVRINSISNPSSSKYPLLIAAYWGAYKILWATSATFTLVRFELSLFLFITAPTITEAITIKNNIILTNVLFI